VKNFEAALIVVGLFAMFFGGWLGGTYAAKCGPSCGPILGDSSWRIQWEVLLTGLAAITGGYFAYRGALEPIRQAQLRKLLFFQKNVEIQVNKFLAIADARPAIYSMARALLAKIIIPFTRATNQSEPNLDQESIELEQNVAKEAAENLPALTQDIYSVELDQIVEKLKNTLLEHGDLNKPLKNTVNDVTNILADLDAYIKAHS